MLIILSLLFLLRLRPVVLLIIIIIVIFEVLFILVLLPFVLLLAQGNIPALDDARPGILSIQLVAIILETEGLVGLVCLVLCFVDPLAVDVHFSSQSSDVHLVVDCAYSATQMGKVLGSLTKDGFITQGSRIYILISIVALCWQYGQSKTLSTFGGAAFMMTTFLDFFPILY